MTDNDLFDFDDYSITPLEEIEKLDAAERAQAKVKAGGKIAEVIAFISANPSASIRDIQDKFKLAYALGKEFKNGLCRVNFYTDESMRFYVMDHYDQTSNWFLD